MRILLLLLLAPLGVLSQSLPYYLADGLNDFTDQQFRGTNPVYVTLVGTDSMIISTSAGANLTCAGNPPGRTPCPITPLWTSMPSF
jgi:hypothetical protein